MRKHRHATYLTSVALSFVGLTVTCIAAPQSDPPSGAAALSGYAGSQNGQGAEPQKSPLSFKIGDADFTPGGFMDFTAIFRSTNVGSGIGTTFGTIPYNGTLAESLSETRLTMQNSRLSLGVTSKVEGYDVKGYVEADFLGNAAGTVFVTSNSNTLRSRLYWVQLRKNKFEFLGGQSWTMLTPNRNGLSPVPSDIFYSQDMDTNYQVGLTWARQAGARFIYHATDTLAAGVAIENSQQFVGATTLPSKLPVSEVETGIGNPATPNLHPDIIAKIAFDPMMGKKHQHFEIAGLLTSVRVYDTTANLRRTATGGGGAANFNFEVVKNLHAILNTFYSDGGGRYIFALGPQFVVRPDSSGVLSPAMLHSGSGIAGFEYQLSQPTMLYGYYGGGYFTRYKAFDPAVPFPPGKLIGYGYSGSPNTQNRAIQEGTFGVIQTFWKNPRLGALQLITQYSYLTRAPWFEAVGGPKNAHVSMGYVNVRYVLP